MESERHNLLAKLAFDVNNLGLFHPQFIIQAVLLVLCWGCAYWLSLYMIKRFSESTVRWKMGGDGIKRVLFPVLSLIFVSLANLGLHLFRGEANSLLSVANLLMLAMVSIRLLVYVIRLVFNGAAWVQQGEKYISAVIWIIYVLHVAGFLAELLDILDSVSFNVGAIHISVLTVLQGILSIGFTLLIAMWIGRMLEQRLMSTNLMDMNVRVVLAKVMRSLLVVVAILLSLSIVGIDLTVLSVFGGALGVGLGFGLQKIASNYASGFIILLDRSIKLGDLISVDNRQGIVSGLTSRYVVLKGLDGTESLVPNDTLVTSTVVNQSYNDRSIWVKIPVSVAYESDLNLVLELLEGTLKDNPRISQTPAPRGFIEAFGASSVDLCLGFWLRDPENGTLGLRSDIHLKIWQAFRERGINIPFNRLDVVHFRPDNKRGGDGNLEGTAT